MLLALVDVSGETDPVDNDDDVIIAPLEDDVTLPAGDVIVTSVAAVDDDGSVLAVRDEWLSAAVGSGGVGCCCG